jgi:serine/threonine protein kinase
MTTTTLPTSFHVGSGLIERDNLHPDFTPAGLADMYAGAARFEAVQNHSQSSGSQSGSADIFWAHDLYKDEDGEPSVALKISRRPGHELCASTGDTISVAVRMHREYLLQCELYDRGFAVPRPIDFTFYRSWHGSGVSTDYPVIAMDIVFGESLRMAIYSGLKFKDIFPIGYQLAGFLDGIHGEGVIHRDVKPANLMLTNVGEERYLTVLDLGNSNHVTFGTDIVDGAIGYMSPETYCGHPPSITDDNFGMLSTIFTMLTGTSFITQQSGWFKRHNSCHSGPFGERWKGRKGNELDKLFVSLLMGKGSEIPIYREPRTSTEMVQLVEKKVNGILRL